jgi:hypothetical protein
MLRSALARLRSANRRRTVDVWFIGYPKTGNTWLRFLLGCYVQERQGLPSPPLFDEFDRLGRARRRRDVPRMSFTHEPLAWSSQTAADLTEDNVLEPFSGKRVVLLVRHPLDALVSHWHQFRTRAQTRYEGDLVTFLDSPVHGLDKLLRFYSLWEPAVRRGERVLVVRYEDMRADADAQAERVLSFLGVDPIDSDALANAVERSSFSSMQAMERSGHQPRYASSGLGIFATGDRSDPNAFHVRRGAIGGYREELSAEATAAYELRVAAAMSNAYGYALPARATESPAAG